MYSGGFILFRYLARQMGDLTIENTTDSVVKTFRGNDYVENSASNALISTSLGDDTIDNYGGAGDDLISMTGDVNAATIIGGNGDDNVYSDNVYGFNTFQYTTGDGNDEIYFFVANDTLQIGDGTGTYSTTTSGSDIILRQEAEQLLFSTRRLYRL